MDENKKIREVRVVGYSRELLFLQLMILVSIFSLLAVAISSGGWQMFFVVCFLCLLGYSLFQASRIHRKGVTISICGCDAPEDAPVYNEDQDTTDDDIGADDDIDTDEDEDLRDKPHWADSSYPDPDVELGLKNPLPANGGESGGNEDSDANGQTAKDKTRQ